MTLILNITIVISNLSVTLTSSFIITVSYAIWYSNQKQNYTKDKTSNGQKFAKGRKPTKYKSKKM